MVSALSETSFLQFLVSYILVGTDFLGSKVLFPERLIDFIRIHKRRWLILLPCCSLIFLSLRQSLRPWLL